MKYTVITIAWVNYMFKPIQCDLNFARFITAKKNKTKKQARYDVKGVDWRSSASLYQ